ncbi:RnfH family protein [Methylomonas lenta]|uniref:RnfH family protein n=1 Tax=Methylomonas lenta TaxID=980561 RepID=UPI0018DB6705|nr:RnfH family protein [Methylomonas lenta]
MSVEVAYAGPDQQVIIPVLIPAESTAEQAIGISGIVQQFPEIDLATQKIGIFGAVCKLDKPLLDGDRVEIYRPLLQDPMAARRNRLQR